jgi:hypothetical protein
MLLQHGRLPSYHIVQGPTEMLDGSTDHPAPLLPQSLAQAPAMLPFSFAALQQSATFGALMKVSCQTCTCHSIGTIPFMRHGILVTIVSPVASQPVHRCP